MKRTILEKAETMAQLDGIMDWINTHSCCSQYVFRLIDLIGATLVGVKPAELINVPINRHGVKCSDWEECRFCLLRHPKIKLRRINKGERKQALIYHRTALDQTLRQTIHLKLLKSMGYPLEYTLEGYVEHLVERLNGDEFPHEIGIFLGYPTKDVLGFMGHPSLKLVKTKGWQYYGNERVSRERYEVFLGARKKVRRSIYSFVEGREMLG